MIIDSSALLAWLLREPDGVRFGQAIAHAKVRLISAANWLETAIVIEGRADGRARDDFEQFVREEIIRIVPLTEAHVLEARSAWLRYGRRRHKASLNYGDTMAYATARLAGEPLLFKGDDFPHIDIEPVLKD